VTEPLIDLDDLPPIPTIRAGDLADQSINSWEFRLWVDGRVAPQGSKNPMPIFKGSGADRRIVGYTMVESSRKYLKPWREKVTNEARKAWTVEPYPGPVLLGCAFLIAPPQDAREGDWAIKKTGPFAGDLSHLVRAIEDALKNAGALVDDCLVVGYLGYPLTGKRYARPAEGTGCQITLRPAVPIADQWRGFRPPVRHRSR
jgi:Holliday junction resolvase RusA-like endonuclease